MRLNHAIAVTAAILIGLGVKLFFFPAPVLKRTQAASKAPA